MAKGKKKTGGPREIRVFIASPGDLAVERRAFKDAIELLNVGFGDGAEVQFESLGWEDTLATTGRRVQSVIDQDIDTCDVFVLALHRRWGQEALTRSPTRLTRKKSSIVRWIDFARRNRRRYLSSSRTSIRRRGPIRVSS